MNQSIKSLLENHIILRILGKIATILISISGIGIIAIPTGIIAGAFSQTISKKK